jgi:hypothetical protein
MRATVRRVLLGLVYAAVFLASATLLVPDPTGPLAAVPVVCGWAVAAHALTTDRERALAYTTVSFFGVLLTVAVLSGVVAATVGPDGPPSKAVAQPLTTLGAAAALLALYALLGTDLPGRLRGGATGS